MPFDFKKYDAKCATMDGDALQREWEHYTRLISGAATSTAVSGMAIPFTLGVSSIGVGLAAPAIHNARKKREIIERHLQRLGRTHHTRKRDVIAAGAISGTVGVVTLGLAPVGADAICNSAAEHGIAYIAENELGVKIATHLALDAAAVAAEETHMHSKKEQEAGKAYTQADKEGKNPSLPNSDLKIPATTNNQTVGVQVQQYSASPQPGPPIDVIPPPGQNIPTGVSHPYFPPPPGQTDSKVDQSFHHRRSTSTSSFNAQQASDEPLQPQYGGRPIQVTSTAISAPMTAGQSYCAQDSKQAYDISERPLMTGGAMPLAPSVGPPPTINGVPHQMLSYPPPPPPPHPPHFVQSEEGYAQQPYQTQTQRPRAHSTASFDRPPHYEGHQQVQPYCAASQLPLPLSPAPPPSTFEPTLSPVHTSGPTLAVYSTVPSPAAGSMSQYQPPQNQNASVTYQPAGFAQYNPNDYFDSREKQHQSFHAPAQMVYSPQDIRYQANHQKAPLVHEYRQQDPAPPGSGPMYYPSPGHQPQYSYPPEKTASWQVPYFPPPPPAY